MGSRTIWEKLAPPVEPQGDDAHVRLDAILPTRLCLPLRAFYDSTPFYSDTHAPTEWACAAQAYLDSGLARYGARVGTCDPHAVELGAYGIAAFHHAPAALVTRGRDRQQPVGGARRILVRVNDPLPASCDAVDIGFHLGLEAGPTGLQGAVLAFEGPGVDELDMGQRRRMLAAAAVTGCLTAFGPLDERARQAWWQLPALRPPSPEEFVALRGDDQARHDELLIVNASRLQPLMFQPRRGAVAPLPGLEAPPLRCLAVGGCMGGDWESLQATIELIEQRPPQAGVDLRIVPASEAVLRMAQAGAWDERARQAGATVCAPSELPETLDLATSPCLAATAWVASPRTVVASAHAGGLVAWEAR